ncbi:MAG: rhodanese-like domain-containing protein [Deltaproteobacteria bacterium]|nr:rhodanese-like domain-containing protein [Deltaproteobacteria bacterium]
MRGVGSVDARGRRAVAVSSWPIALRDAGLFVLFTGMLAIVTNALREDGLPWVQKEAYEILVPCPETTGETTAVRPDTPLFLDARVLIIDGRHSRDFEKWHVERAINIPFDYLEPTPSDVIDRTASSRAREVLVYGDGKDPDSGEQLARELAGKGIRNVHFVAGGAPAIMAITNVADPRAAP